MKLGQCSSRHCFAARDSSTNHNAGVGFSCQWPARQCYSRERRRRQRPCRAPLQSAALPPMAGAPWLNQSRPYLSAYMALPAWPMYMPSYLPLPQVQQSSTQAEHNSLLCNAKNWWLES